MALRFMEGFESRRTSEYATRLYASVSGATWTDITIPGRVRGVALESTNAVLTTVPLVSSVQETWVLQIAALKRNTSALAGSDIHIQNSAGNQLKGGGGNDSLFGGNGDDHLLGNGGKDLLNSGAGKDRLEGGAGADTYITDGADHIVETSDGGIDTIKASGTATLSAHVENLTLTGGTAINGTGNALANRIDGNSATNTIAGGAGNDTLTGGSGKDTFVFDTALGAGNRDTITDFRAVDDTIMLDNAVFTGLGTGTLSAAAFAQNTSGNAADRSDRIIYEADTGKLWFDRDGTGSAARVHVATLDKNLALTQADFLVF